MDGIGFAEGVRGLAGPPLCFSPLCQQRLVSARPGDYFVLHLRFPCKVLTVLLIMCTVNNMLMTLWIEICAGKFDIIFDRG